MCCIVKCCNCHFILARDMAGVACWGLVCLCGWKNIGMTIHKSIAVLFLPCLDPFMFFHFFEFFFCCCFFGGEKTMVGCLHSCSLQVHRR